MAEFIEVMKQANRMCHDVCKCSSCPIRNMCDEVTLLTPERAEQFVKAVTKWAAEHPEPEYPTWSEWLEEITGEMCDGDLLFSRIPESTAKRLGIESKGAKDDG